MSVSPIYICVIKKIYICPDRYRRPPSLCTFDNVKGGCTQWHICCSDFCLSYFVEDKDKDIILIGGHSSHVNDKG